MTVYTIGYASFARKEEFFDALIGRKVSLLIDVRSTPYSSFRSDYNKDILEKDCKSRRIYYRNYKEEFGARQTDERFLTDGAVDFEKFASSDIFLAGIEKVMNALGLGLNVCLMCAEKDPMTCHRAILIGRALHDRGVEVIHISGSGEETQNELERRLLAKSGFTGQTSLFDQVEDGTDDQRELDEAYRRQAREIAFTLKE